MGIIRISNFGKNHKEVIANVGRELMGKLLFLGASAENNDFGSNICFKCLSPILDKSGELEVVSESNDSIKRVFFHKHHFEDNLDK